MSPLDDLRGVADHFGIWCPDGDSDQLRADAQQWRSLGSTIDNTKNTLDGVIDGVLDANTSVATDAVARYWRNTWKYPGGLLPKASDYCGAIAGSLDQFAGEIDSANQRLEQLLEKLAVVAGVGVATGLLTLGIGAVIDSAAVAEVVSEAFEVGLGFSEAAADIATDLVTWAAEYDANNLILQVGNMTTNALVPSEGPSTIDADQDAVDKLLTVPGADDLVGGTAGGIEIDEVFTLAEAMDQPPPAIPDAGAMPDLSADAAVPDFDAGGFGDVLPPSDPASVPSSAPPAPTDLAPEDVDPGSVAPVPEPTEADVTTPIGSDAGGGGGGAAPDPADTPWVESPPVAPSTPTTDPIAPVPEPVAVAPDPTAPAPVSAPVGTDLPPSPTAPVAGTTPPDAGASPVVSTPVGGGTAPTGGSPTTGRPIFVAGTSAPAVPTPGATVAPHAPAVGPTVEPGPPAGTGSPVTLPTPGPGASPIGPVGPPASPLPTSPSPIPVARTIDIAAGGPPAPLPPLPTVSAAPAVHLPPMAPPGPAGPTVVMPHPPAVAAVAPGDAHASTPMVPPMMGGGGGSPAASTSRPAPRKRLPRADEVAE